VVFQAPTWRSKPGLMKTHRSVRLALFEPDIPQNTGTLLRLAACLNIGVDIIEPCGFVWGGKHMRRAGMDYLDHVDLMRHLNWQGFAATRPAARRVLLTTKAAQSYAGFTFKDGDILVLGSESAGVPTHIHDQVDARVTIPMRSGQRSLNLATAAAMVVGEALRQLDAFPKGET